MKLKSIDHLDRVGDRIGYSVGYTADALMTALTLNECIVIRKQTNDSDQTRCNNNI